MFTHRNPDFETRRQRCRCSDRQCFLFGGGRASPYEPRCVSKDRLYYFLPDSQKGSKYVNLVLRANQFYFALICFSIALGNYNYCQPLRIIANEKLLLQTMRRPRSKWSSGNLVHRTRLSVPGNLFRLNFLKINKNK